MLSPINLRGYEGDDPLDRLPSVSRYLLAMAVTAVVSTLLVLLITRVFRLVQFADLWVGYVEVASFTLFVAPCVVTFRKSTSLLHYAFVLLWFIYQSYADSILRKTDVLPTSSSVPTLLWRCVLLEVAFYAGMVIVVSLLGRFELLGNRGLAVLFAYPDSTLGNSLTLHATFALLWGLMARYQQAQECAKYRVHPRFW